MVNDFREADYENPIKALDDLLRMSERESRVICALATKMRLTQQSRWNAKSADTAHRKGEKSKAPWAWER